MNKADVRSKTQLLQHVGQYAAFSADKQGQPGSGCGHNIPGMTCLRGVTCLNKQVIMFNRSVHTGDDKFLMTLQQILKASDKLEYFNT